METKDEAETRPLATAWHSNKFINPASDGASLPILHLTGHKIANPTILARITREELERLFRGYGWTPLLVEGDEPDLMHEALARALKTAVEQIKAGQEGAHNHADLSQARRLANRFRGRIRQFEGEVTPKIANTDLTTARGVGNANQDCQNHAAGAALIGLRDENV